MLEDTTLLSECLAQLYQRKIIRAIDHQFAHFLGEQVGSLDAPIVGWGALLSFELGKGNVCIDLNALNYSSLFDLPKEQAAQFARLLDAENAVEILSSSTLVSAGENATPLVLERSFKGRRLYLHRYWVAQQNVASEIKKRAAHVFYAQNHTHARDVLNQLFCPDIEALKKQFPDWDEKNRQQKLVDFFDIQEPQHIDFDALISSICGQSPENILAQVPECTRLNWQKVAAAVALSSRFCVISGGPGTGKTTTVAKLLAALISCHTLARNLEIKLVAPTGKAANRLTQSLCNAVQALPISADIREKIPVQASTIHRLLGAIPQRVGFRHHQDNPLHLDVLVVDEASMVDLSLMAKLLAALPSHARVILLGDRDQLASVEAGSVLGDICMGAKNVFSAARADILHCLTGFSLPFDNVISPVTDGVCLLQKSYRFHAHSGIGQLAYAINSGDNWRLENTLKRGFDDIKLHDLNLDVYSNAIVQALEGYRPYLTALNKGEDNQTVLHYFSKVRVLCALTQGPFGVAGLNQAIEHILTLKELIVPGNNIFYPGRPIMITQNDHALGLYNGDMGIVTKHADGLRVVFEIADGSLKAFLPSRLPEHQTAYAMTIHKSQGSEFDHTLLILPPAPLAVMTRELVYTGITRAKNKLDLYATRESLSRAMRRKTKRFSGLANALEVL